jgi:hypothetical protein
LPANATPITAQNDRRLLLTRIMSGINSSGDLEDWVARSPLVAVAFKGN